MGLIDIRGLINDSLQADEVADIHELFGLVVNLDGGDLYDLDEDEGNEGEGEDEGNEGVNDFWVDVDGNNGHIYDMNLSPTEIDIIKMIDSIMAQTCYPFTVNCNHRWNEIWYIMTEDWYNAVLEASSRAIRNMNSEEYEQRKDMFRHYRVLMRLGDEHRPNLIYMSEFNADGDYEVLTNSADYFGDVFVTYTDDPNYTVILDCGLTYYMGHQGYAEAYCF